MTHIILVIPLFGEKKQKKGELTCEISSIMTTFVAKQVNTFNLILYEEMDSNFRNANSKHLLG